MLKTTFMHASTADQYEATAITARRDHLGDPKHGMDESVQVAGPINGEEAEWNCEHSLSARHLHHWSPSISTLA